MTMQRRGFLQVSVATVSGLLLGCGGRDGSGLPNEAGDAFFPQSVASGDPRAHSVVLWTRVDDADLPDEDLPLELELFLDEDATDAVVLDGERRLEVTAQARFDRCLKVRVEGLDPATHYYYRFAYVHEGVRWLSRLGRTRTAPASEDDVPVRFAFVSCQDYGGRYYNSLAHLATQEVDFVVHLGDYIYETLEDEGFQASDTEREIVFEDQEGAMQVARGDDHFVAARSLNNYRQLYRTFRSDPALQRVHERFPVLAIWDDHEFTDDCFGSTGTYTNGREDEYDPERRQNASQVWFEFMPVDYAEPNFEYDRAVAPPDDIRIYRDFSFGRHLHLVLGDVRSYRSQHLVPPDAYPGAVMLDQAALEETGGVPEQAGPYVEDIAAFAGGVYAEALRSVAAAADYPTERIAGPVSAQWIASTLAQLDDPPEPIDEETLADLPRGLAYHHLGKTSFHSRIGSRFFVAAEPFRRLAEATYANSGGSSEEMFGPLQEEWFLSTLRESTRTWKVWANQFCLMPLQVDLSGLGVPDTFRQVFEFTLDDWNGMPNRRAHIIEQLDDVQNLVAITGDIHAFFAATPFARPGADARLPEFAVGSISSNAMQPLVLHQVRTDPTLSSVPGAESLAAALADLFMLSGGPNAHLGFADISSHGYAIAEVEAGELRTTFYGYPYERVHEQLYGDGELEPLIHTNRFRVVAGSRDLHRERNGAWQRWNPSTRQWE
jgi:alkaline phosphatase D